jgi:acetyl esterase/lipase/glucose/arabinose dehydrogenase
MTRCLATLTVGLVLISLTGNAQAPAPPRQGGPGRGGPAGGPPVLPGPAPNHVDLDYATADPAGTGGHKLDLYLPAATGPLPVVIWTGGSAWMSDAGKRTAPGVAAQLLPAGYAVAGVSIRSSSQVRFPGQLHDMKAAVRWLRANASRYNLDPDRIAIMGDSSGGWTSAMTAVTGNVAELEGMVGTTGVSSRVRAAVAFYPPTNFLAMDEWAVRKCAAPGCHDDVTSPESRLVGCAIQSCPDRVQAANPVRYVSADDPPMLILHGNSDPLVPHNQGEQLYMALNKACREAVFISLPKAGHGPWNGFLTDDGHSRRRDDSVHCRRGMCRGESGTDRSDLEDGHRFSRPAHEGLRCYRRGHTPAGGPSERRVDYQKVLMPTRLVVSVTLLALAVIGSAPIAAQRGPQPPLPPGQTNQPFPQPIVSTEGVISVSLREFASLPDVDGVAARMMRLVDEPASRRLFVSDMHGLLYSVSADGRTVTPYLDIRDPRWATPVQSQGRERGFQNFVLHPQFGQAGTPGFGKFYTYTDTSDQTPAADFRTGIDTSTHDTVLQEWTARTPAATTYDGGGPRELMRFRQPYANHNGGMVAFNSTARPGSADFGLLYVGVGDGGSGGDPQGLSQNLGSGFGKILRIDPLGKNGRGGKYGIPPSNPFLTREGALPEIFAYGIRNAQRFAWDSRTGAMFTTDIGQNVVEEVSPVTAGANLGWNIWEGSYRYVSQRAVILEAPRSDPSMVYPIVEWDQLDPVLLENNSSAAVSLVVYRSTTIPQLTNRLLFGDMPSGAMFHVSADTLPTGGQDAIRLVRFVTAPGAPPKPVLEIIQDKNRAQSKTVAFRGDVRFDATSDGRIFVLNKADGTIRVIER